MYSQNTKFIPFEFHLRRTQSIFEKLMLVNRHVHRKKRSLARVKTKPSIVSSYIHHGVLYCFSFFCCFEFLGTCEFRVAHNSPDSGLKKLTQQLVSSVVHLCQGVNNIRFAVTPSLRRFEFFPIASLKAPSTADLLYCMERAADSFRWIASRTPFASMMRQPPLEISWSFVVSS